MISLTSNTSTATINAQGAWAEELTFDGQPILYPKTELRSESGEYKTRGGMHVCLPNFGPGGESDQPQHGYGRTLPWTIVHQTDNLVELTLQGSMPHYSQLLATLRYEIQDHRFLASLTLHNNGVTSLRVAPGFHPYFFLDESETAVSVNETIHELESIGGTVFLDTNQISLQTAHRHLTITQQSLPVWALWTDGLANYVCAEPTVGGYRFLEKISPEERLVPSDKKAFSCTISW